MSLIRNRSALNVFSFFKSATRTYSVNLDASKVSSNESNLHIFTKTFTKTQLVDHMINSIIHNKDGILVLDKPYGIGRWREFEVKNVRLHYQPKTFEDLALSDVIDAISNKLGFEVLSVKKVPEKYASGILILTANETAEKKVSKYILRADSLKTPDTYLLVTCGNPCKNFFRGRFGIKFNKETKNSHFVDEWSKNSQKRSEVFGFNVYHEVLSSSELGSLVKVKVNTNKHNALRLYMVAKCMSPILGDDRFGSRIVKMGDVGVDLGPENPQSKKRLTLPPEILEALYLRENESQVVPVHMHLYSFPFIQKGMKECTELIIPPPEWFIWTCRQLKLDVDSALKTQIKSLS